MHRLIKWAPLYHGLQLIAIEGIQVPPALPKKWLRNPYYNHCAEIRTKIQRLKSEALSLYKCSDTFFSSDAEYCFTSDYEESVGDFLSAMEDAIDCYMGTIRDHFSCNMNFGPGEGYDLDEEHIHFDLINQAALKRLLFKTQPAFVKYLEKQEREDLAEQKKRRGPPWRKNVRKKR